jgi:hypothetical protein
MQHILCNKSWAHLDGHTAAMGQVVNPDADLNAGIPKLKVLMPDDFFILAF